MPTHDQVRMAVAMQGDPEFSAWTAQEQNYLLRSSGEVSLQNHSLFFVIPVHLSRPLSFYVAFDEQGQGQVLTDHATAVGKLLAREPELMQSESLEESVVELIRDHESSIEVLRDSEAVEPSLRSKFVAPSRSDQSLRFLVSVDGRVESWQLTLGDDSSRLERVPLIALDQGSEISGTSSSSAD